MNDPHVLSLIIAIFALLGIYSLYTGSRRMRAARRAGQPMRWYKQAHLLTGVEYILLTFVFLLSLASQQRMIASSMRVLVEALYFLFLIPAAVIACLVIRQILLSSRAARTSRSNRVVADQSPALSATTHTLSKREQEEQAQRQRDRRKKAATSRRRKAGKA